MREASARRKRRKPLLLAMLGAILLGAAVFLTVHFIPKPLGWLLPKGAIDKVYYRVDASADDKSILELDDDQQGELIELIGETRYRRVARCQCIDTRHLFVRYEDGTVVSIGEHWIHVHPKDSAATKSFSTRLYDCEPMFKFMPYGLDEPPAQGF